MYHLFNIDNETAKIVHTKEQLLDTLQILKGNGANFCLDIDNDIMYSFEDDFESTETIEDIMNLCLEHIN